MRQAYYQLEYMLIKFKITKTSHSLNAVSRYTERLHPAVWRYALLKGFESP
jgi:hypothetical protein